MFTKTAAAFLAAAGLAAAAPVNSTGAYPPPTTTTSPIFTPVIPVDSAVVTHRVAVGLGGLRFEPNNIFANVGEVVEFKFLAANHSVAQSSFGKPCEPIIDAGVQQSFFAGFDFPVAQPGVLNPNVFQIVVKDTKPIWFYCPQQGGGGHCQKGMVGSINQNPDSPANLLAFTQLAAGTGVSTIPAYIQGGISGPNPNPNAGFP